MGLLSHLLPPQKKKGGLLSHLVPDTAVSDLVPDTAVAEPPEDPYGLQSSERFDPEGSGYDRQTAQKYIDEFPITIPKPKSYQGDYVTQPEAFEAWVWHPDRNDYFKHQGSLDARTGMVLKGRQHPTWDLMEEEEKRRGSEIVRREDGRYYTQPVKKRGLKENVGEFFGEISKEYSGEELADKMLFGNIDAARTMLVADAARRLTGNFDYTKPAYKENVMSLGTEPVYFPAEYSTKEKDLKLVLDFQKEAERQAKLTIGGKIGGGISRLAPYMAQIAISGITANPAQAATKEIVKTMLGKYAQTAAGKLVTATAGLTTSGVISAAVVGAPQTVSGTEKRAILQLSKGEKETPAKNFMKAWTDTVITYASERAGESLGEGLKIVVGKMPFGSKLVGYLASRAAKKAGGPVDAAVDSIFKKMAFGKWYTEFSEEWLESGLQAVLGTEDFGAGKDANMAQRLWAAVKTDFTPENLLVTGATLAAPSIARKGLKLAGKITYTRKDAKDLYGLDRSTAEQRQELFDRDKAATVDKAEEEPVKSKGLKKVQPVTEDIKVPPRPLVNPKATALQQDEQLQRQQEWDKKYGEKYVSEARPKPLADASKQRRREILQARIKRGESVGGKVLAEFEGEEWAKQAPAEVTEKQAKSKGLKKGFVATPELPSPEQLKTGAESLYSKLINRFAPIENIEKKAKKKGLKIEPGQSPAKLARSFLGIGGKADSVLENSTYKINEKGEPEANGEGLKPILDDFESKVGKEAEADFKKYLLATRIVEDLQRPAKGKEENIATPEQTAKAKKVIDQLGTKYELKDFEETAKRLYGFQERVLHLLVDSGNLSQEMYDKIVDQNKHYIPFDRVLDKDTIGGGGKKFSEAKSPVKAIKGSEREIQDPYGSIIKNVYRILDVTERNRVARSVADLAGVLPEDISPVRVTMIPIRVDPREILTISKEFSTQSAQVMKEFREVKTEGGEGADVSGPIKKLEKVVKDALTHRGFSEGEAKSFVNQIRKGEAVETPEMTTETIRQVIKETQNIITTQEPVESTIFRPSQFKPKGNTIEYFVDGKRKYIEVTDNLYQVMEGLNEVSLGILTKILSVPAKMLRVGATMTPEFMSRNLFRDQFTAFMQTNVGFVPFVDSIRAISHILGKSDTYYEWLRSGGAQSGFVELNRRQMQKTAGMLQRPMYKKVLTKLNIITSAQDLSQLFEQSTRLGIYKAAKRKGLTSMEAGFEAREGTLDFARRGSKMRDANSMIAFFNAGIQAADKMARTAYNDPGGFMIKGIASITLPSLLLYLRNRKDPKYFEIPRWQRDLFWIVRVGDTYVRVPKPFAHGQIFGSLPERFFEYLDTKDSKAFDGLAQSVYDSLSPVSGEPTSGLLPTALKPVIENVANWSFFRQRDIVPRGKEQLLPAEQYSRYTSMTARELGKAINYSPAKIENLIQGYLGGSGKYLLEGGDWLINQIETEAKGGKPEKDLADVPLVSGWVVREGQYESVQQFYERANKVVSARTTMRKMAKEGRRGEAEKIRDKTPDLKHYSRFNRGLELLSRKNGAIDAIFKSTKYTPAQKKDSIRAIEEDKLQLAQNILKIADQ